LQQVLVSLLVQQVPAGASSSDLHAVKTTPNATSMSKTKAVRNNFFMIFLASYAFTLNTRAQSATAFAIYVTFLLQDIQYVNINKMRPANLRVLCKTAKRFIA